MMDVPGPIVLLEWEDAEHGDGEWRFGSKLRAKAAPMWACGVVVKRSAEALVIASAGDFVKGKKGQSGGIMTIPCSAIVQMIEL